MATKVERRRQELSIQSIVFVRMEGGRVGRPAGKPESFNPAGRDTPTGVTKVIQPALLAGS